MYKIITHKKHVWYIYIYIHTLDVALLKVKDEIRQTLIGEGFVHKVFTTTHADGTIATSMVDAQDHVAVNIAIVNALEAQWEALNAKYPIG